MDNALYINDNNLLLSTTKGVVRSQGYAWLDGKSVRFDSDKALSAVKNCRLAPQQINSRYWQQMDQSAIPSNEAGMRHAADLVWQHLSHLKQTGVQELALVVPSHFQSPNLQLLLGVAKATELNVLALANKAVLSLAESVQQDGEHLHIDLQLHQTVLSSVSCRQGKLTLQDVEVITDVGIHQMQEALMKALQQSFIQHDRFDPLYDAASEQQMFNQLDDLGADLIAGNKISIGVEHQSRLHSIAFEPKEFNLVLTPFVERIVSAADHSVQSRFIDINALFNNALPNQFEQAGLQTAVAMPGLHGVKATKAGEALTYVTEVPISGVQAAPLKAERPSEQDSHSVELFLLQNGQAIATNKSEIVLNGSGLVLKASDHSNLQDLLAQGKVFVVGDESRKTIQRNDRLASNFADGLITVIEVQR